MKRFTNILFVPLTTKNNPRATRRIADLALRNDASLTVLGIVGDPSRRHRLFERPHVDTAIRDGEQAALIERLERCCRDAGYDKAEQAILSGDVPLVVVRKVLADGHDLVVVTTDEDKEDNATVRRLLRKCPCPVWVIRPTRARITRVLAAVDPDPAAEKLNREVLDLAVALHDLEGGELHVVHAWQLQGESTLRSSAFIRISPEEIDRFVQEERDAHWNALQSLIARYDECSDHGVEWTIHFHRGKPAEVVNDLVRRKRINLLVIGTVARSGVPGLLIGNTAEQLIEEVRCSVIAAKPPGFVSPVPPADVA